MTVSTKKMAIEEWRSSSAAAFGGKTGSTETVAVVVVVEVEVTFSKVEFPQMLVPLEKGKVLYIKVFSSLRISRLYSLKLTH